jgi:hypothetical protein
MRQIIHKIGIEKGKALSLIHKFHSSTNNNDDVGNIASSNLETLLTNRRRNDGEEGTAIRS